MPKKSPTPPRDIRSDICLLEHAFFQGEPELLLEALAQGVSPSLRMLHGFTPAMRCSMDGHLDMLRALAMAAPSGMELDFVNDYQANASTLCVADDNVGILHLLIELGADVDACIGANFHSPCLLSAQNGSLACLDVLARRKDNLTQVNNVGQTPLHLACFNGQAGAVELLITLGASLLAGDNGGKIPLTLACQCYHHDTFELLLQAHISQGATVDAPNLNGETPLMQAARQSHAAAARQLITYGANPLLQDRWGDTAMTHAIKRADHEMIAILESAEIALVPNAPEPLAHAFKLRI
jgi:ankyrin repeat protein